MKQVVQGWESSTPDQRQAIVNKLPIRMKCRLYARYCTQEQIGELRKEWARLGKTKEIDRLDKELRRIGHTAKV